MSMAATPDKKTVVRELMKLGKQKGQLTNQDILDAIGEIDFDPEQLEKLYDSLAQLGIEIVEDSGDIKIDDIDLGFDEGKDGDSHAQIAETGSVSVDDPVRYILKKSDGFRYFLPKKKSTSQSELLTVMLPQNSVFPRQTFVLLFQLQSVISAEVCSFLTLFRKAISALSRL